MPIKKMAALTLYWGVVGILCAIFLGVLSAIVWQFATFIPIEVWVGIGLVVGQASLIALIAIGFRWATNYLGK